MVIGLCGASPSYEDHVTSCFYRREANGFPQPSLHLIPNHSAPSPFAHQNPEPADVEIVGYGLKYQEPVGP